MEWVNVSREREKWLAPANTLMNCKGKANPLQAWTGPEGTRRLWLPDFKTVGT